ncbi:MAG: hypothetical protein JNN28_02185 [Saprospiraceae bacterium]|nr:hypothetical protein [Saprospiraceae bacterium]
MNKKKELETFGTEFWLVVDFFILIMLILCLFPIILGKYLPKIIEFPPNSGTIGDTIGGTMGPFVAIIASALTFLAFWIQFKANEQQKADMGEQKEQYAAERAETRFLEMVKICRDNINELKYEKYSKTHGKMITHEGRRVAVIIFREFTECLDDIDFLFWSDAFDYYVNDDYQKELQKIVKNNKIESSILDMIKIDIAYHIIYFGLGTEGRVSIEHNFKHKYKVDFSTNLLNFISIKPKLEDNIRFKTWNEIIQRIQSNVEVLKNMSISAEKGFTMILSDAKEKIESLKGTNPYEKYYGGHQHRLGHYFRHLFNSYVYLDSRKEISNDDKYLLSKLLRAQLSTYEQALILINSISSLGMSWEYKPKDKLQVDHSYSKGKLITTYNVITNLPGEHLNQIKYKDFYPQVKYEFDEM